MIKKICLNLCLLFCSLILVALLAEGMIRILKGVTGVYYPANWSSPSLFYVSSDGYSLIAGKKARHFSLHGEYIADYTINNNGFRSANEYQKDKPVGTKRILMLGDSMVFGLGVNDDQTIAASLEHMLNQQASDGMKFEVLNLGVAGYTLDNSYLRMKRYLEFSPDLVIFVVLGVNDFLDIIDHTWTNDENGDIVAVEENFRHINEYSRFVNGPVDIYSQEAAIVENAREFLRQNSVGYTFLGTLRHRNRQRGQEIQSRSKDIEAELEGVCRSKKVLDRFFELTTQNNIENIFILDSFYDQKVKDEFMSYLFGKTKMIIDLNGMDTISQMRFRGDGHWTILGNKHIAELISNYIKIKQLL